jgi:hypothetical protein
VNVNLPKDIDYAYIYLQDNHIVGMKFREATDKTEKTFVGSGISAAKESEGITESANFIPASSPIMGIYGSYDDKGLTSIGFVVADLDCAGGKVEERPADANTNANAGSTESTSGGLFAETKSEEEAAAESADEAASGETSLIIIIVVAAIPVILIIVAIICIMKKKKQQMATFTASKDTVEEKK